MRQPIYRLRRYRLCWQDGIFLVCVLLLLNITLAGHIAQARPSPQATANIAFSQAGSLAQAIEAYPKVWPPLYPVALYAAVRLGIPAEWVNQLCLSGIVIWVFLFTCRLRVDRATQYLFIVLFALAGFHYENGRVMTAEVLFSLLGLLCFDAIYHYARRNTTRSLLGAGLLAAGACTARYFGLFWLVPLGIINIWLFTRERRQSILAPLLFAICVLGPVALWIAFVYTETGTLSGMDRFSNRALPPEIAYWSELTGLEDNLLLTARTLWIDFFSPHYETSHEVVNGTYRASPSEYLALLCVALLCATLPIRCRQSPAAAPFKLPHRARWLEHLRRHLRRPAAMLFQFFAGYLLIMIALWTIGNNDPIYGRFVYPAYAYFCLASLLWYRAASNRLSSRWLGGLLWLLYLLLIATHISRSILPLV